MKMRTGYGMRDTGCEIRDAGCGMIRFLLTSVLCLLIFGLAGCATRPKTYKAPDATKVKAALETARATATRAKTKVEAAQKSADRVAGHSVSVMNQVEALLKILPAEYQPQMMALKETMTTQQEEEGLLIAHLSGAWEEQGRLEKQMGEVETYFGSYQQGAVQLAVFATEERVHRITAEKQLFRQKVFGWLFKIGGGLFVVGAIVLLVMWRLGKLTFKSAAIAAKLS